MAKKTDIIESLKKLSSDNILLLSDNTNFTLKKTYHFLCKNRNYEFYTKLRNILENPNFCCPECLRQEKLLKIKEELRTKFNDRLVIIEESFTKTDEKADFLCKKHNKVFSAKKENVLKSKLGICPDCKKENSKISLSNKYYGEDGGTAWFIEKARSIHGDFYDYSLVDYRTTHDYVEIICPIHGSFSVIAWSHISKYSSSGCRDCYLASQSEKNRLDWEVLKSKIEKQYPNILLDSFKYINYHEKSNYSCTCGRKFYDSLLAIKKNGPCHWCNGAFKYSIRTTKDFIERAEMVHGTKKFNYNQSIFNDYNTKIKIKCNTCRNFFYLTPHKHISGQGCSNCFLKSKGEEKIVEFLKHTSYEREVSFTSCQDKYSLPFDFVVYDKKNNLEFLIEYDGQQHFEPIRFGGRSLEKSEKAFRKQCKHDQIKNDYCKKNNIPLLRIPYWEFENLENIIEEYQKTGASEFLT